MLSRLALKAVQSRPLCQVAAIRQISTTPVQKSEERDLVNFPRRTRPIDSPPVRVGFIPDEWFVAVAKKSGSTGPYVFLATFSTFLASKEYFVIEHDFWVGLSLAIVGTTVYQKFGASFTKYLDDEIEAEESKYRAIRQDEIDRCADLVKEENHSQWMATSYETLIEAKKENVALQLEAAYRSRLQHAYDQVKKRLDYQMELANVQRRLEQKHMVNYIIDGVTKSISAKQEEDALKKCISDLKALA